MSLEMATQDLQPSYEGLHDQPLCALQSRRVVLRAVGMAGQALCKLVSQRALHRAGKGLAVTVEGTQTDEDCLLVETMTLLYYLSFVYAFIY